MANVITVEQLFHLCREQIINGNGKKKILISADDEGNGYHALYYSFSDIENAIGDINDMYAPQLPYEVNEKNVKDFIILG